jgi:hypothetical protein
VQRCWKNCNKGKPPHDINRATVFSKFSQFSRRHPTCTQSDINRATVFSKFSPQRPLKTEKSTKNLRELCVSGETGQSPSSAQVIKEI